MIMKMLIIITILLTLKLILLIMMNECLHDSTGFNSEGGWCGWKPSSSSNCSHRVFRAYPLIEIRQTVPCRAIRGKSISVNSTLPPLVNREGHAACIQGRGATTIRVEAAAAIDFSGFLAWCQTVPDAGLVSCWVLRHGHDPKIQNPNPESAQQGDGDR